VSFDQIISITGEFVWAPYYDTVDKFDKYGKIRNIFIEKVD
jgi:hypothetical protein